MTPASTITSTDRIWEALCQVPSKGRTHSELRRQFPDIVSSTISSVLAKFNERGHITTTSKRKGDVMMEAVYVIEEANPWVTKAERRAAKRKAPIRVESQAVTPQPMPLEVPQAGQGKPRNSDWLEGYTDALLGRPSALSHYSEGYLAGVNARAAR